MNNNNKLKRVGVLILSFIILIQFMQSSILSVYGMENSNIRTVTIDFIEGVRNK